MKYKQCKCGKSKSWSSGMPEYDCQGCEECQTTYASNPEDHKQLIPHKPKKQFDRNTGELSHYICERCCQRCDENGISLYRSKKDVQ